MPSIALRGDCADDLPIVLDDNFSQSFIESLRNLQNSVLYELARLQHEKEFLRQQVTHIVNLDDDETPRSRNLDMPGQQTSLDQDSIKNEIARVSYERVHDNSEYVVKCASGGTSTSMCVEAFNEGAASNRTSRSHAKFCDSVEVSQVEIPIRTMSVTKIRADSSESGCSYGTAMSPTTKPNPHLSVANFISPAQRNSSIMGKTLSARSSRISTARNGTRLGLFTCYEYWEHENGDFIEVPTGSSFWALDTDPIEYQSGDTYISKMFLSPTSQLCAVWGCLCIIAVIYDCVVVPMELLNLPEYTWRRDISWVMLIFWSLAIPCSFVTGYVCADGQIEVRLAKTTRRYLTTWFVFDISIVMLDLLEMAFGLGGFLCSVRMARALKLLRLARLVRVLKLPHFSKTREYAYLSQLGLYVALLLMVNHLVACLWYGVCKSQDRSWITENGLSGTNFPTRYSYSLHWATTQFLGEVIASPTNNLERWFSIFLLLFAFVASAGFVSGITASLTHVSIVASRQKRQFAILHRYLEQHSISSNLAMRVKQAAEHAVTRQQKHMPEKEVELLALVTPHLRSEMHFEVYSPIIRTHCFFDCYCRASRDAVLKICHKACKDIPLASLDVLFGENMTSSDMFFITSGRIVYQKPKDSQICKREGYLCEASLWCYWKHIGSCRASQHTTLLALNAKKLYDVTVDCTGEVSYLAKYAQAFVQHLREQDSSKLDDLTCGSFNPDVIVEAWLEDMESARRSRNRFWFLPDHGGVAERLSENSRKSTKSLQSSKSGSVGKRSSFRAGS